MSVGNFCAAPASDRFAARLLADTDCQAFGLIERGYAALAAPGSTVSAALTGLLVIAVAFFGYRLLLGRTVLLTDAIGLTIKIGVVLLIATSWEAWQTLAYQGLARAPSQIASEMLVGIGAPPPLESLEKALDSLTAAGVGYRARAGIASPLVGGPAAAAAVLNISAILLTLSTVGILVATRVVLAILLAIAPAMAGFILFDGTRGMAQGWLGVMAAAAIAPLFVLLVAAVEFAILAPMLTRLLSEQAAGTFENSAVMPIGLVALIFVLALLFAVRASSRIGEGIRLAGGRASAVVQPGEAIRQPLGAERTLAGTAPAATPRVARALEVIARRDSGGNAPRLVSIGNRGASSAARDSASPASAAAPRGDGGSTSFSLRPQRSTRMRPASRRSRLAARRDA